MDKITKPVVFFLMTFLIVVLGACKDYEEDTSQSEQTAPIPATSIQNLIETSFPSQVLILPSSTATLNPTQQIWIATHVVIENTQQALDAQEREQMKFGISQFPLACKDSYDFDMSPDGKWLATNCGDKTYSHLVVQSINGIKWVLDYQDFLPSEFLELNRKPPGGLITLFWDIEESYLYFSNSIGWSGGSDFCFSGGGTLGLFRLDLQTGLWVELIEPPNYFPGDEIEFSPTGRQYAVNIDGIRINDLKTGEVIQLDVNGFIESVWSPDGTKLAYSIAKCNEEGYIVDSSLYVWDSLTNTSNLILRVEKALLFPVSWNDFSALRIDCDEYIVGTGRSNYTFYEYDIMQDRLIFIGPYSILNRK